MKQRVKIITDTDTDSLEKKINEFLDEYEIRSVQVLGTTLTERYMHPIEYVAVIKYQEVEVAQ